MMSINKPCTCNLLGMHMPQGLFYFSAQTSNRNTCTLCIQHCYRSRPINEYHIHCTCKFTYVIYQKALNICDYYACKTNTSYFLGLSSAHTPIFYRKCNSCASEECSSYIDCLSAVVIIQIQIGSGRAHLKHIHQIISKRPSSAE